MSRPVEVPDAEFVLLRPCEGGQLLQHLGTGEAVVIKHDCALQVREGNAALVWAADGREVAAWACDFFMKALLRAPRELGGAPEFLIHDPSAGESSWRNDVAKSSYQAKVVQFECVDGTEVFLEVYMRDILVCKQCLRWGLSRWVHYARGGDHNGRWMTKSILGFKAFVAKMKYDDNHIRSSRKSVVDSSSFHGVEADLQTLGEYDPDWAASTEGLVMMCLLFATSGKYGHDAGCEERAINFLQGFVSLFLTSSPAALRLTDEADQVIGTLALEGGQVCLPPGAPLPLAPLASLLRKRQPLVDLLVDLASTIRRPSQCSQARCSMSVVLLHNLVDYIAGTVDSKRKLDLFHQFDHLSMPELYRCGSARPRRISNTMKQIVSREVLSQPSLRNAQQLLAARRILFGGVRKKKLVKGKAKVVGVHPGTGRTFCEVNMRAYMQSAKDQLGRCKHGYVGMDGTRVSAKDLVFYVFEAVGAKKACWLVPKVGLLSPEGSVGPTGAPQGGANNG